MLRTVFDKISPVSCSRRFYQTIAGRVALVAGVSLDLGRQICVQLSKKECNIAFVGLDCDCNKEDFVPVESEVQFKYYKANLANYLDVQLLKEKIEKDLGFVDILINNAAISSNKSTLDDLNEQEIERDIRSNLLSNFWTLKEFLPGMKERKHGHIATICSFDGLSPKPLNLTNNAMKFGLRGLMDGLRLELDLENSTFIKTSIIYPGFLESQRNFFKFLPDHVYLKTFPTFTTDLLAVEIINAIVKEKHNVPLPSVSQRYLQLFRKMIL